ncbi:hypothetical protein TVAG_014080 [Trichomonas vaginalis G3]|uniref:SGF29 C-terminal domain-containing protein n=1 Tax=Trichomonas vaginalis (strain ATCC PRA-98 / G3) TaxID=412133 RepID=A2DDG2_TRIV3|nr:SGF29 tudor-like domain family [Trichomonas vaginalis G3]EAY21641.1 hypothetical protein TVAG_014080 [Trichomonas vaginalis G3]KAI5489683.1 SGF29 tudor-like domain family [Trichomonas vaginalis G3]|eukprot:XP_001582627.1 hypothetical protein [Trichomonas vaginalis G3]
MSSNLMTKLKETINYVTTLNQLVTQIKQIETDFYQNPGQGIAKECETYQGIIGQTYDKSIDSVNTTINAIEQILEQRSKSGSRVETSMPTREELDGLLLNLFHGKPKTRHAPIPNYCGCYAYRSRTPSQNQFVCANINRQFLLMMVYKYENDTVYVIDPYTNSSNTDVIELKSDQWTPLPTIIPEKPIARWEHAKNAKVLALMPAEGSRTFFPATVIARPYDIVSDGNPDQIRGYQLDFGDDDPRIIPEQFVVNFPENWKSLME